MGKLYIAYGSNLNLIQMTTRCPSATIYSVGQLNNRELIFRGSPKNSHATIRRCKGKRVPVLVWDIKSSNEKSLDRYEGYPIYYFKKNITVDMEGKKKKAMVYLMDENQRPGIPSSQYVQTIRQGYIDNHFDMEILEEFLKLNRMECR